MTHPLPRHKALCFDAFGTLVESGDNRHGWHRLVSHLPTQTAEHIIYRALTEPLPLDDLRQITGADEHRWHRFLDDLHAETSTIQWRKGLEHHVQSLIDRAIPVALCSNLAQPYVTGLQAIIDDHIPRRLQILSCDLSCRKPEPEIYAHVSTALGLPPSDILFIGDTPRADVDGPREAGFNALLIDDYMTAVQAKQI
ncbi:MAG: HAD family hydrolase [Alphaproteobacteria bacterium]